MFKNFFSGTNYFYGLNSSVKRGFSNLYDKVTSLPGRENKFYILSSDSNISNLVFCDVFTKFYKLTNKNVINPVYEDNLNQNDVNLIEKMNLDIDLGKHIDNKFHKDFLKYLVENKVVYSVTNQTDNQTEFYIDLKRTSYLKEMETDDLKLKQIWPGHVLQEGKTFLKKKTDIKIKFNIVNETDYERSNIVSIEEFIEVHNPEFLFGITFLSIKNNKDNLKLLEDLGVKRIIGDRKSNFILPSKIFAINPINNEKIPIVILADSAMENSIRACVPGHERNDFILAKELSLPIKYVAKPIYEMADQLFSSKDDNLANRSKSIDQIKQELVFNKMNEGPILLNKHEAFLTNCKEFDFLNLDEARELLVNNLIIKGRAERRDVYLVEDWLIAKTNQADENNLTFEELFKSASNYLRCLKMDRERFKKWLPVDLLIFSSKNDKTDYLNFLFYSRIIHRITLDLYKSILPEVNDLADRVYTSKEQELENDILFPAPFKHIINISNQNLTPDSTDGFRLNLITKDIEGVNKFFKNLDDLHKFVIQSISQAESLDLEKIRDEMIDVNEASNNQAVTAIFQNFIKCMNKIKQNNEDSLKESFKILAFLIENVLNNKEIFSDKNSFLFYFYFNYLLITYPFTPSIANLYWQDVSETAKINSTSKFEMKKNISEYSLANLNSTCNYFIHLLMNTVRLEIVVNRQTMNILINSNKAINDQKSEIISYINENFKLGYIIKEDMTEFIIEENKLFITSKNDKI